MNIIVNLPFVNKENVYILNKICLHFIPYRTKVQINVQIRSVKLVGCTNYCSKLKQIKHIFLDDREEDKQ